MRNADQFVQSVNFFSYLDNAIVVNDRVENQIRIKAILLNIVHIQSIIGILIV